MSWASITHKAVLIFKQCMVDHAYQGFIKNTHGYT